MQCQVTNMWGNLRGRLCLKCDGTRAETRFHLSAKRTNPFKSVGASVQSTTGSRGVRISGSNVGYTMFRGSVKSTGNPLHSLVSSSLPLPCVTVCHHVSTGLYCSECCTVSRNGIPYMLPEVGEQLDQVHKLWGGLQCKGPYRPVNTITLK